MLLAGDRRRKSYFGPLTLLFLSFACLFLVCSQAKGVGCGLPKKGKLGLITTELGKHGVPSYFPEVKHASSLKLEKAGTF